VHVLVAVFRRAKVTSDVPAAPEVPATRASRTRAVHPDPAGVVELVDEALVELPEPPDVPGEEVVVVVGALECDVHADKPTVAITAAIPAPRYGRRDESKGRDGRDRADRSHRCSARILRS
jgi:hypothetical protein